VWQICLLEIILDAASAIFHLFEAFMDFWIMFMFAHPNFIFLSYSGRKWLKPMGVWQICLLGIILDAASAIFHLFEAFLDFWIVFMFAHWNFKFLSLSGRKWLNPLRFWQICLLEIILDAASAIFHLFEAFLDFWIMFKFAHPNFIFLSLSDRKWLNPLKVWQICLLEIILDAASAIFHLFEAFFDFWIMFKFAHWNYKFLSLSGRKWLNPLKV
jgi:hypothetical protein